MPALFNRIRIRVKQLRYRVELLSQLQPPPASLGSTLKALKRRQELLGDLQDMHVLLAYLGERRRRWERRGRPLHAAALQSLISRQDRARLELDHRFAAEQEKQPCSALALAVEEDLRRGE